MVSDDQNAPPAAAPAAAPAAEAAPAVPAAEAAPAAPAAAPAAAAPAAVAAPAVPALPAEPAHKALPAAAPAAAAPVAPAPAHGEDMQEQPFEPPSPPGPADPDAPPPALLADRAADGPGDKGVRKGKRKMTLGEAFRSPVFYFRIFTLVGFLIIMAGVALVAEGHLIEAEAYEILNDNDSDAGDMDKAQDMLMDAPMKLSQGYTAVAVGLAIIGIVVFMEYLLTNVQLFGKKR
jgi:hypothetical protein